MYCPKCSQQQTSDDVRFCSRCGFQLNVVKALLSSDSAPTIDEVEAHGSRRIRRKDVNAGATLMLIGAALAAASTTIIGGPPPVWIGGAMLVFTAVLIFVLLFSRPLIEAINKLFFEGEAQDNLPTRRSDANVGAMMMFMATLIPMFIAMLLGADTPTRIFSVAVVSFVFTVLFSNRLARTVHYLFFEDAAAVQPVSQITSATRTLPALTQPQSMPIANISSQRVNTAEMVQPPSITEHTTTLLDRT